MMHILLNCLINVIYILKKICIIKEYGIEIRAHASDMLLYIYIYIYIYIDADLLPWWLATHPSVVVGSCAVICARKRLLAELR
jgi:hypothetical protein